MVGRRISPEEKFAAMLPQVRSWINRGYGSGEAYGEMQRSGYIKAMNWGVRKTDFLRMYREHAGMERRSGAVKYVGMNRRPSERIVAHTLANPTFNYIFKANVKVWDEAVNEERGFTANIGFYEMPTIGEVQSAIQEAFNRPEYGQRFIAAKLLELLGRME